MLDILTAQINAVVPISGLSADGDDIFDILYITPPTEEQQAQVAAVVASWPLEKAKLFKLQQLDATWAQTVKTGWATPAGWNLGLDISDVTLLTGAFMLAKEAANVGFNAPAHIIDTAGVTHELSLAQLTEFMLAYGQTRSTLSGNYAATRQAIIGAATPEELTAISI
jgi:hypothetical protein